MWDAVRSVAEMSASHLAPETEEERAAFAADVKEIKTAVEAAFKEKCAALEAAFNRLPMPPPQENGIPYKEVIPGIARELALMGLDPKRKPAPAQRSLKKTAALMAELAELAEAIDGLPPDTLIAWLNGVECEARSIPTVQAGAGDPAVQVDAEDIVYQRGDG